MTKNNKLTPLTILTALYLIHNVPVVGYYTPAVVFLAITILLYFVLARAVGGGSMLSNFVTILPVVGVLLMRLVQVACFGERETTFEAYSFIQILIYPLLGLYVMRSNDYVFSKAILKVIIITYVITAITTIIGCKAFPNAARVLTGGQDDLALYGQFKRLNIGDFHFVYFISLTLPLLIGSIRYKAIRKYIGVILVVLVLCAVYFSAYTTALLFCFMALLLFFVRKDISGKSLIGLSVAAIIVVLISRVLLSNVFSFMAANVGSQDMSDRLGDVSQLFIGGSIDQLSTESDVSTRFELFSRSWNAFVSNPILGSWRLSKLGGHSFILDTLGLFGFLGMILLFWMYIRSYKLFVSPYKGRPWYPFILASFILILAQAYLNPQPTINVLSFVIPVYACVMDHKLSTAQ